MGLLALMLLHDSRREARATAEGELVLLCDQDRSRWDRALITEGVALVERALRLRPIGPYAIQAAIAALHAEAPSAAATDWNEIVGLYDGLLAMDATPVVELNRAVAVAMRDGPACGLALIDAILTRGELADYRHAHSARARISAVDLGVRDEPPPRRPDRKSTSPFRVVEIEGVASPPPTPRRPASVRRVSNHRGRWVSAPAAPRSGPTW